MTQAQPVDQPQPMEQTQPSPQFQPTPNEPFEPVQTEQQAPEVNAQTPEQTFNNFEQTQQPTSEEETQTPEQAFDNFEQAELPNFQEEIQEPEQQASNNAEPTFSEQFNTIQTEQATEYVENLEDNQFSHTTSNFNTEQTNATPGFDAAQAFNDFTNATPAFDTTQFTPTNLPDASPTATANTDEKLPKLAPILSIVSGVLMILSVVFPFIKYEVSTMLESKSGSLGFFSEEGVLRGMQGLQSFKTIGFIVVIVAVSIIVLSLLSLFKPTNKAVVILGALSTPNLVVTIGIWYIAHFGLKESSNIGTPAIGYYFLLASAIFSVICAFSVFTQIFIHYNYKKQNN